MPVKAKEISKDVLCEWTPRGKTETYDCPNCGSWTANLPLYRSNVCSSKERRFSERRKT